MADDKRKSVLITGCSKGGIGHSLALEFHKHGLRVFATARDKASISDLKDVGIETLSLTVDNEESVKACYEEVAALVGGKGLNYLVNNAWVLPAMLPYVFGSVYNASKAALHSYSDTLRVELAPFGVKVITLVTGGVKSRIARVPRALPKDSLYYPINADYQRRLTHSQQAGIPNEQYASQVVTQILYGPAPWRWLCPWWSGPSHYIWAGGKVWLAWLANWGWTWYGVADTVISWMFGINKLKRRRA
ncbi:hypothetical protein KEM52_006277 [Ascosphaera acerosa]|nr:hypothetical protein KEM52_006277 [Ascosphaera acerosa]